MRHWLLTWTFYGTWLPGALAGFVSKVRDEDGNFVIHNVPGTPYDADMPALEAHARSIMKGPPVHLGKPEADALVAYVRGGGAKRLAVERFDGDPVTGSDVLPLLVEAGFLAGPRRAVLRP